MKEEEDWQKTDSEDEADEESTPIPSSAAAAQAIEKFLLYATHRGDMGILNGSMDLNAYEELVRGLRVSELGQTKKSDFAPKSTALQIELDMFDYNAFAMICIRGGRRVSEQVQTKMSDFAPNSTAPQIDLDMFDYSAFSMICILADLLRLDLLATMLIGFNFAICVIRNGGTLPRTGTLPLTRTPWPNPRGVPVNESAL